MIAQETLNQLYKILGERFEEDGLRSVCFDLGIDYESLPPGGKISKARELVNYLDRRRQVSNLVDLILRQRPDIKIPASLLETPCETASDALKEDFVNRKYELQQILDPGADAYIEVCAPSGYGKTYLLRRIAGEKPGLVMVDFKRLPHARNDPLGLAQELAKLVVPSISSSSIDDLVDQVCVEFNRRNTQVWLLFDSIESADDGVQRWIIEKLLPAMDSLLLSGLGTPKLRCVAATRRPTRLRAGRRYNFHPLDLTPLRAEHIRELMVNHYFRQVWSDGDAKLSEAERSELALYIEQLTQGHPWSIKYVLDHMVEKAFIGGPRYWKERQKELLERCVLPVIRESLAGIQTIPDQYRLCQAMCVFRRFTLDIVGRVAEHEQVPGVQPLTWISQLNGQAQLFIAPRGVEPMYRVEPLIRRVIAFYLKATDWPRFVALNQLAANVFRDWALDRNINPEPAARLRVWCITENLLHNGVLNWNADQLVAQLDEFLRHVSELDRGSVEGVASQLIGFFSEEEFCQQVGPDKANALQAFVEQVARQGGALP